MESRSAGELQEALRAADESSRHYAAVFDCAPVGFVTLDSIGLVEDMNLAAGELLDIEPRRAVGFPFRGFVDCADREPFLQHLRRCACAGGIVTTELRLRGRQGRPIPAQLASASAHPGPRGPCYCTALIDLTELRDAENARQRETVAKEAANLASEAKDRFLAALSHELRNPLAPLSNSVYILERAKPGGDQARRAIEIVGRQVRHLGRLVEDLLDLARINTEKIRIRRSLVDLNELVLATVDDHRAHFAGNGVELELVRAPAPVPVEVDSVRIVQVLGNLLNNAVKFTDRGGRTLVSVECSAGKAVLRVCDTGAGIAPDVLPQIFEPFVQADETLARSQGGLGLGLALVRKIVELHGGTVDASSAGPRHGSEFIVCLPLTSKADARHQAETSPEGGRLRVLVIEDNVDTAESLRDVLELEHHVVEVAHRGLDGLKLASSFAPTVVVCDIGLPDMDGYQVARAFRADKGSRVRLIALSGYALDKDVAKALAAGFDAHLAKPLDVAALLALLRAA